MNVKQAYDSWASQYDTNANKTRDLEGQALRTKLADIPFASCLEIGCGTGKNTQWLVERATQVMAVDLSPEMLAHARQKVTSERVIFQLADITSDWSFRTQLYDLVVFSLVLEHIADLAPVFQKAAQSLNPGGYVYLGELHPFKQYLGTKARFDTVEGRQVVECFTHHVSDFIQAGKSCGLAVLDLDEHFDTPDRNEAPRILTLLLQK